MAGLYADVPARRMAYHRDGSLLVTLESGGSPATRTLAEAQQFNSEGGTAAWASAIGITRSWHIGWIFPELRTLRAYFFSSYGINIPQSAGEMQWSADTTNIQDGAWTNIAAPWTINLAEPITAYRTAITSITPVTGIKGVRFRLQRVGGGSDVGIRLIHLYGEPDGAATRYLAVTDTGGTEVGGAYFDFDDDPRGVGSEVIQFKVKNLHGTLTANTITVGREVRTDKATSFIDDYEFSSDGVAYASSLSLGSLAAGASSATLYLRRTTPLAATMGIEAGLITVVAASWS